jgi:hypothetical protein
LLRPSRWALRPAAQARSTPFRILAHSAPNRPGSDEPRAGKRRRHHRVQYYERGWLRSESCTFCNPEEYLFSGQVRGNHCILVQTSEPGNPVERSSELANRLGDQDFSIRIVTTQGSVELVRKPYHLGSRWDPVATSYGAESRSR